MKEKTLKKIMIRAFTYQARFHPPVDESYERFRKRLDIYLKQKERESGSLRET